jgi:hypothetical protein
MSGPKRIQRKRTKGWRMPDGAVYVGRPTKWGNPARIGDSFAERDEQGYWRGKKMTREDAMAWFREHVRADSEMGRDAVRELRGKDLACWCPLDLLCHADVLLELANARAEGR